MQSIETQITRITENDFGFIIYMESREDVDGIGTRNTRKYKAGFKSISEANQAELIDKTLVFDEDAVTTKKYTLPEDHESAGTVVDQYWVTGKIKVKA